MTTTVTGRRHPALVLALVGAVVTLLLVGLTLFVDNTNLITGNGLWKSIGVRGWVNGTHARIQPANVLYFPLTAYAVGLIENVADNLWQAMALVNCLWAGAAVAALAALLGSLGLSPGAIALACVFQLGCGTFLALAITSEDIMGALALFMASTAVAVNAARRPTLTRMVLVSVLFTASWLFEWRILLPAAPAMIAGVLALPGPARQRARAALAAVATTLTLVALFALAGTLRGDFPSFVEALVAITWPGKGVGSGWGGLSWQKLAFLADGMARYVAERAHPAVLSPLADPGASLLLVASLILIGGLAVLVLRATWRQRNDPRWRVMGSILGVNFAAAQALNVYSQPQDPQMQLNAMVWLAVAWAVAWHPLLALGGAGRWVLALALSATPLVVNLSSFLPQRGVDSRQLAAVRQLERHVDPQRTVFVAVGMEAENGWLAASWGWAGQAPPLVAAPQATPGYKVLFLRHQHILFPGRSPRDSARAVRHYIDYALTRGFRVVFGGFWAWTEERFCASWATVAGPEKPRTIWRTLKQRYRTEPLTAEGTGWRHFIVRAVVEAHP